MNFAPFIVAMYLNKKRRDKKESTMNNPDKCASLIISPTPPQVQRVPETLAKGGEANAPSISKGDVTPLTGSDPRLATVQEPLYKCDNCSTMRTKAQGGTTFTVCDECWNKLHPKTSPLVPPQAQGTPTPNEVATPRTDAEVVETGFTHGVPEVACVEADFARTLERELTAKDETIGVILVERKLIVERIATENSQLRIARAATLAQLEAEKEARRLDKLEWESDTKRLLELRAQLRSQESVIAERDRMAEQLEQSQYAVEAVETKCALLQKSIADLSHPNIVMLRVELEAVTKERNDLKADKLYNHACINTLATVTETLGENSETVVQKTVTRLAAAKMVAEALESVRITVGLYAGKPKSELVSKALESWHRANIIPAVLASQKPAEVTNPLCEASDSPVF